MSVEKHNYSPRRRPVSHRRVIFLGKVAVSFLSAIFIWIGVESCSPYVGDWHPLLFMMGLFLYVVLMYYCWEWHSPANYWKERYLNTIRAKIEVTNRSRSKEEDAEDLLTNCIYRQDVVQQLQSDLSMVYSDEYDLLRQQYSLLTDLDRLILTLLGLGHSNAEICSLLHMERRTLYRRRQLMAQRMDLSSTDLERLAIRTFTSRQRV